MPGFQKTKQASGTRQRRILVFSVLTAIVLLILFFLVFFPSVLATGRFSSRLKQIRKNEPTDLLLTDSTPEPGDILQNSREVYLQNGEAKALCDAFTEAFSSYRYLGDEKMLSGHWDYRMRVGFGETDLTFYLTEDSVYYAVGSIRYYFVPRDDAGRETYSDFYAEVERLLRESAAGSTECATEDR